MKTTIESKANQLAQRLRRDAARYQKQFFFDGDAEFERMVARDVRAMNAVADIMETGDLRAAYRRASRLDTVVRDGFSKSVWNALSGGRAFGHDAD